MRYEELHRQIQEVSQLRKPVYTLSQLHCWVLDWTVWYIWNIFKMQLSNKSVVFIATNLILLSQTGDLVKHQKNVCVIQTSLLFPIVMSKRNRSATPFQWKIHNVRKATTLQLRFCEIQSKLTNLPILPNLPN